MTREYRAKLTTLEAVGPLLSMRLLVLSVEFLTCIPISAGLEANLGKVTSNQRRLTYHILLRLVGSLGSVSYTHLRAHETRHDLVCRLLLEKKKKSSKITKIKKQKTKNKRTQEKKKKNQ